MRFNWQAPIRMVWREQFPSWVSWVGFTLGIAVNFSIYYFSSKAFVPGPEFKFVKNVPDFFSYVILGELALMTPMILFQDGPEAFRRWKEWGIWETLFFSPNSWPSLLLSVLSGQLVIKLALLGVNFAFAFIIFGLSASPLHLFFFLCWQIASFFLLMGFYFTFLSVLTGLKKGFRINSYLSLGLSVLSGAYFPLEVFGDGILRKILSTSPLSLHVKASRDLWMSGEFLSSQELGIFLTWSAVFWGLGLLLVYWILRGSRSKFWE